MPTRMKARRKRAELWGYGSPVVDNFGEAWCGCCVDRPRGRASVEGIVVGAVTSRGMSRSAPYSAVAKGSRGCTHLGLDDVVVRATSWWCLGRRRSSSPWLAGGVRAPARCAAPGPVSRTRCSAALGWCALGVGDEVTTRSADRLLGEGAPVTDSVVAAKGGRREQRWRRWRYGLTGSSSCGSRLLKGID